MSQYDPDAPEGSRPPTTQYVSIKDIRVIVPFLLVLGLIVMPTYKKMAREGMLKVCKGNVEQVSKAVLLYAEQHDMRFPPSFAEAAPGVPFLENGVPVTWVTSVAPLLSKQGNFGCPIADEKELCANASPNETKAIKSAFGFAAGMSTQPLGLLNAPTDTVFLSESSNNGSMGTYNPVRLLKPDGGILENDGFLIGYDNPNGNIAPSADAQYMTRLAFYEAATNEFGSEKVRPRHDGGLFVIFADGHLGKIGKTDAEVTLLHDEPQGFWRAK